MCLADGELRAVEEERGRCPQSQRSACRRCEQEPQPRGQEQEKSEHRARVLSHQWTTGGKPNGHPSRLDARLHGASLIRAAAVPGEFPVWPMARASTQTPSAPVPYGYRSRAYSLTTFVAWGPFGPWDTSNSTD